MDYGRIHWFEPEELDESQQSVYEAVTGGARAKNPGINRMDAEGRLYGPFNAMLIDAGVGMFVQDLGAAIRFKGGLSEREREIAILEVAVYRRSDFEWSAHREIALKSGLTEDDVEAIFQGTPAPGLSEAEAVLRKCAKSLLAERGLSDADYAEAVDKIGLRCVADLVYLIGYYEMMALSLSVFSVPLPPKWTESFS